VWKPLPPISPQRVGIAALFPFPSVLASALGAEPCHLCAGGSRVLFLSSAEARQVRLLFWQLLNPLTKDVLEGTELLTDSI